MKKSFIALTLLAVMMAMPMSLNANTRTNTPECNTHRHHHFHDEYASAKEVTDLVNALNRATFESDKMNIAMSFLRQCPMEADDIRFVAKQFTFESDKLTFLKNAFRYCVNPYEYYKVRGVLTFSSDQEEIMRFVDSYLDGHTSHNFGY